MDFFNNMQLNDEKKGMIFSLGAHVIFFLLLLLPWFSYEFPPPEQEGILVTFGTREQGNNSNLPDTQNEEDVTPTPNIASESQASEVQQESEESTINTPLEAVEAKKVEQKKVITSQESNVIVEKGDNEEAEKLQRLEEKKKKAEELRKAEKRKKAEEKRIAEEKRKLEEERKKREVTLAKERERMEAEKKQFGSVFGSGVGAKDNSSGNQGDINGDPNSDIIESVSKGSGVVGGGLGNRGVTSSPRIIDKSQKEGRVVMDVCVDHDGKVISVHYTQKGSTTADKELRTIAEKNAYKFRFSKSSVDKQCGTITFNFRLK